MPNCPKCRHLLALYEEGAICPNCKRTYKPEQVAKMPGYNHAEVQAQIALFILLHSAGVLKPGCNKVELFDDGMIITPGDNEN